MPKISAMGILLFSAYQGAGPRLCRTGLSLKYVSSTLIGATAAPPGSRARDGHDDLRPACRLFPGGPADAPGRHDLSCHRNHLHERRPPLGEHQMQLLPITRCHTLSIEILAVAACSIRSSSAGDWHWPPESMGAGEDVDRARGHSYNGPHPATTVTGMRM